MKIFQYLSGKGSSRKNEEEIARLYDLYKAPFISFLLKYYPVGEEVAQDIYQESFSALCRNVREGKYTESKVSLKTYLFEIGKRRTCSYLNRNKVITVGMENLSSEWMEHNMEQEEWGEAQEIVAALVEEADENCRRILRLYYWERLKMEEIATRMGYKTEQVAKNKKSSCLRRLSFELKRRLEAAGIHWSDKE